MDFSTGKGGKVKGVRRLGIRKIVMVKLIKEGKKYQVQEQQKVQSFGKSSGVIP
jgi:hypothetical protein